MENKEPNVELTTEPTLQTRFGFGKENRTLSNRTVKYGAILSGVALIAIFVMKTPEENHQEGPGVKTPETFEQGSKDQVAVDSYSAVDENKRMKERSQKRASGVVVRLPGLQKIDRRKSGQIPPGSMVKAVLVTGASDGAVRAEVRGSLRIQGETLIPEGATLLGVGQSTEERLMVQFTQIVFKDGSFDSISAQAADGEDKTVGLRGSKIGRSAMKYGAAVGLYFVGGMAEGLQDRQVVGNSVVTNPSAKNALLNGASKATLETANDTMTDLRNKAPIIHIDAGKEILVIFNGVQ